MSGNAHPGGDVVRLGWGLPDRPLVPDRVHLADLLGALVLQPVEVLRPDDLLHLTASFHNLRVELRDRPVLVRREPSRSAHLSIHLHSQHVVERALFETADVDIPSEYQSGVVQPNVVDPDLGKGSEDRVAPPLFASLSGPSRLVFDVGADDEIDWTIEGLLAAMGRLRLRVAPQALPPPRSFVMSLADAIDTNVAFVDLLRTAASAGAGRMAGELRAVHRLRAVARIMDHRGDPDPGRAGVAGLSLGTRVDVASVLDVGHLPDIVQRPPPPAAPSDSQTALELPWRLVLSPHRDGAFAHSQSAVAHDGRVELWHTRLGLRATDDAGQPTVDERSAWRRTVRAIWARDYDVLSGFASPDALEPAPSDFTFPDADGSDDQPKVRTSLNSRDRMSLVHLTSNFGLKRQGRAWTPQAVPVNRLMLSSLGGWLSSRVGFDTLPDGELTIEEWKHRAALGRDHAVKVVYAGFLLPTGHRASLVKVTERRIAEGEGGETAYLFQRMFLVPRERLRTYRGSTSTFLRGNDANPTRRLDLAMPFSSIRVLTPVTPSLDEPVKLDNTSSGMLFQPHVGGTPFQFDVEVVDLEGNLAVLKVPMMFVERDWNEGTDIDAAIDVWNESGAVDRTWRFDGQRVAFAESQAPDDTALAVDSLVLHAVTNSHLAATRSQDEARFEPVLDHAMAVVAAMRALAGADGATRMEYPKAYEESGFTPDSAQVFLKTIDVPELGFAGQGERSGGFVTPSLQVKGLSRLTGPVGGDLEQLIDDPTAFDVGGFFGGISAKLFGLIPLSELFSAVGFTPDRVPKFVAQTLDVATALVANVERLRDLAAAHAGGIGPPATVVLGGIDDFFVALGQLFDTPSTPPDLATPLNTIKGGLGDLADAVAAAPGLDRPTRTQLAGLVDRVAEQLGGDVTAAVGLLEAMASGKLLPDVVTARIDWSAELDPWSPSGGEPVFAPVGTGSITLAVEVQAPTKPGGTAAALVSCSISPFDLNLIAPVTFVSLHFQTVEFSMVTGQKPDVNVVFADPNAITFDGPLEFVDTLKNVIPFDGFSDPPYLDVATNGVTAGFDLAIPDVAVGVFALTNVALGAHLRVPFIDESIEFGFNFSTRDDPFRLQVSLFAGGGFFGITLTPDGVRVLEAALEFGAAISINFGVASGGVSVMAGIYFRLETVDGDEQAQLTGYFRLRGEVDVLGLISASIELYLEFTYETKTRKAVGRATITVEVEVLFFSATVSISCEKRFAGGNDDPTFAEVMGPESGTPPGEAPWDAYCLAFADD